MQTVNEGKGYYIFIDGQVKYLVLENVHTKELIDGSTGDILPGKYENTDVPIEIIREAIDFVGLSGKKVEVIGHRRKGADRSDDFLIVINRCFFISCSIKEP